MFEIPISKMLLPSLETPFPSCEQSQHVALTQGVRLLLLCVRHCFSLFNCLKMVYHKAVRGSNSPVSTCEIQSILNYTIVYPLSAVLGLRGVRKYSKCS